jgi:hypothetical protein
MKEGLVAGVVSIFLGILAIIIGWTIVGGLGLGIPALVLAMRSYRKGHRLLGVFGIIFSCVGIIEGLAIAGIASFLSILTMPMSAPTVATTETIKSEHQIFKWRLLWEKRLNNTAYELKVSPNGNFIAIITGRPSIFTEIAEPRLIVFSKDGNITYSVDEFPNPPWAFPMRPKKLLRISDEGESWTLTDDDDLIVVKDGKVVWKVNLRKIFSNYLRHSAIVISRDEKYIATVFGDWIYFARRENNSLVLLWKFKLIEGTPYDERIDISGDNRYICIVGYKWITLLDAQGKLIWENRLNLSSSPYLINNCKQIGIVNTRDGVVLILNLEGKVIRKISTPRIEPWPKPIIMDNLIIAITQVNRSDILHIYNWEGKPIFIFKPKGDNIIAIASSLDGKYIAVSDNALRVYLLERED